MATNAFAYLQGAVELETSKVLSLGRDDDVLGLGKALETRPDDGGIRETRRNLRLVDEVMLASPQSCVGE